MPFSREEFMDMVEFDDNEVSFEMDIDFTELVCNTGGIETINEMVDEYVQDGYLLQNIRYEPTGVTCMDEITVRVTADATDWLDEGHIEED